jgi:hypothetical protein
VKASEYWDSFKEIRLAAYTYVMQETGNLTEISLATSCHRMLATPSQRLKQSCAQSDGTSTLQRFFESTPRPEQPKKKCTVLGALDQCAGLKNHTNATLQARKAWLNLSCS